MTPVLFLSCLILFVFVHSEVIIPQSKTYTIITNSYSIIVWYLCSSEESCIKQNKIGSQDKLSCPKGSSSQLCSCRQTYLRSPDTNYINFYDKQLALVDIEQSIIRLDSGTVCDYYDGTCRDPKIDSSVGVCWEFKKMNHVHETMVEEYTSKLNTFLVFVYKEIRITLQLLYLTENSSQLWCTNRLDMVVYNGSLTTQEAYRIENTSPRELGCYPKIFASNDQQKDIIKTETKYNSNNIETNSMHEIMNSQNFLQLSESFWVVKFVCVPVIAALILLHMILSCLQFKVLNDLKNGKSVKQDKNFDKRNNIMNKNQTNTKETYYESVDYDAINKEIKIPSVKTVEFKNVDNELYKEH
ncbi:uncharacterized protein [Diabrotica undecimpunctata]|uniref:uncharacterized protein n=1 Tax=Diabrotica undecimpunctata TaxID=50387 RepID=UPI003B637D9F